MNNKSALSIVGFLLVYVLFFAAIKFYFVEGSLGPTGDKDPVTFITEFQNNALIALSVAFGCFVAWFVLGEWIISATSEPMTWTLTWLVLLIVTLGTATYMAFQGPRVTDSVDGTVATYYLLIGFLPFYLSSVLFSPTNAMYAIWPAEHVRRW